MSNNSVAIATASVAQPKPILERMNHLVVGTVQHHYCVGQAYFPRFNTQRSWVSHQPPCL